MNPGVQAMLVDKLKAFFASEHHDALAVYLFGSVARGSSGPGSDVDIGVLYAEDPPKTLDGLPISLKGDLEDLLAASVDIVVLNHASPDLCHRVFRDGILLLDRDRSFRLRFEVKKRNEYLDFLPVLRLYRRYSERRQAT